MEFLPLFFVLLLVALAIGFGISQQRKRIEELRRFANRLENGRFSAGEGLLGPKLDGAWVQGRLQGRQVHVAIEVRGSGDNSVTWIKYTVEVPNAVARFEASKAGVMRRFGRWLGLIDDAATGHARVDEKFVLEGSRPKLQRMFQSGEMERALDHLFENLGFSAVTVGTKLTVERPMGRGATDSAQLYRVFHALERIARICERRKVELQGKVKVKTQRYGWTGGGQDVLCPYCRDHVDLAGEDVSSCESCRTVHHTECLTEAGGCTVFGCRGRSRSGVAA